MLLGKNIFARLQTINAPVLNNPFATAYIYGLLFGPMTLPCTGPIILSAFTLGTGTADVIDGLTYFFFFGLGFGWPLVLLPLIALPVQRRLVSWLSSYHDIFNHASGILLIAVGIFGILTELIPQIWASFYLTPSMQLLYWLLTLLLTVLTGYRIYRAQQQHRELSSEYSA
jgi:cytochrome c-type biogenesis protein